MANNQNQKQTHTHTHRVISNSLKTSKKENDNLLLKSNFYITIAHILQMANKCSICKKKEVETLFDYHFPKSTADIVCSLGKNI